MVRIATVCGRKSLLEDMQTFTMDTIRWHQISKALARLGYQVDIILNQKNREIPIMENLRYVTPDLVRFDDYDVIKTSTHGGFDFLQSQKINGHPFIISKLGTVVGECDDIDGVYYLEDLRERLFKTQERIAKKSRFVTVLTPHNQCRWEQEHGDNGRTLLVPTGVDREIPSPKDNPYACFQEKIVVFIGNMYRKDSLPEVNIRWQKQFNALGRLLKREDVRLCLVGLGDVDLIDNDVVTYMGPVESAKIWDYQYFADAAIVYAAGEVQDHESSKIYYYLRTGLPVVSEAPVPNNYLIEEARCGFVVPYHDPYTMAARCIEAVHYPWDRRHAVQYILKNHTWDERAKVYDEVIQRDVYQ